MVKSTMTETCSAVLRSRRNTTACQTDRQTDGRTDSISIALGRAVREKKQWHQRLPMSTDSRHAHTTCTAAEIEKVDNLAHCVYDRLVAWHSGRTSVSGRRTFPVLRSTCSWWVTSNVGQPTRPTQPFILSGSINWVVSWNQMCAAVYR